MYQSVLRRQNKMKSTPEYLKVITSYKFIILYLWAFSNIVSVVKVKFILYLTKLK